MARKSIGDDNVKFQVVLPTYIDQAVDDLAARSDLSKAQYIRRVLRQAVEQQAMYATRTDVSLGDSSSRKLTHEAVAADINSFPEAAVAETQSKYGAQPSSSAPPVPSPGKTG